ncbi:MAG: ABC transporter permease [Thermoplasmata archaeon]|nr:MAG: ABC transporter permease [Thermoplasmata archaeon]
MILKNAFRRKGRTSMTIVAVAISMALLVSMLSIAEGILYNAEMSIKESKRDIIISGEGTHGMVNGHGLVSELKGDENISSASAVLITDWSELLVLNITDPGKGINENFLAIGVGLVPDDEFPFLGDAEERRFRDIFEVQFNDWFSVGGDPHFENGYTGEWSYEILIDEHFAGSHNLTKGSELAINNHPVRFHVNGTISTILSGEGIFEGVDIGVIVMHLAELQSLLNLTENDVVTSVSVSLEDEHKDVEAARAIARDIKVQYPFYSVMTKEDRLDSIHDQLVLARLFYTAIGSVSMIIGLLFVACIMIMSITERTNEFGMMRAIGISKKTIFTQTLMESMAIVVIGALIGLYFGYIGSLAMGRYLRFMSGLNQEFTVFTPSLVANSLLLVVAFGSLISMYPAWQAARKRILEALRFIR